MHKAWYFSWGGEGRKWRGIVHKAWFFSCGGGGGVDM